MPNEIDIDPCIICTEQQAETIPPTFSGIHQNCPRCGEFKVSGRALTIIDKGLGKEKRAKLSGWIFEQYRSGVIPMITGSNLDSILSRPLPSIIERATSLLQEAEHGLKNLGETFNIGDPRFLAATYSSNREDVSFLLKLLSEQGLTDLHSMGGNCVILPSGYLQLDELRKKTTTSSQGFIAMWFDPNMDKAHIDGLQLGIMQAGYNPLRIDNIEHINKIDDEIIRQIKASKFVVADFTGHRGGVYFEAGFAMGLDIPVFWTCRKDEMDKLHFDIRQFNCLN